MFSFARREVEPTRGGAYLVVMLGPDRSEYPCQGVLKEVVENEKLLLIMIADESADGNDTSKMLNTITQPPSGANSPPPPLPEPIDARHKTTEPEDKPKPPL